MNPRVFQFRFDAVPQTPEVAPGVGGAFVVCYIRQDSEEEARAVAVEGIESDRWVIRAEEFSQLFDPSDHEDGSGALEYYEQCLTDGKVFVFYSYPLDDAD